MSRKFKPQEMRRIRDNYLDTAIYRKVHGEKFVGRGARLPNPNAPTDEQNAEKRRAAKVKVSLPKFSWDNE